MDVQMKNALFKQSDPISEFSFFVSSRTACDRNSIHEVVQIWLCPHVIRERVKAALSYPVTTDKRNQQQKCKLATYYQTVKNLIQISSTDDFITKAEADLPSFIQPASMSTVRYSEDCFEKAIRYDMVYNRPSLKEIFVKGLRFSIFYLMRTYW